MKARLLLGVAIIATAAATPASAQTVRPESLSYMSRLFRMNDVGGLANPRYSRDGRWLAFDARSPGDGGWHIFVVAANGGTPIAITTGTHTDVRPMWSAAGDRLVFISTLTGGVMTIAIDPATGRATSPVKRVTIDSVTPNGFDVAPDGKSVAYVTPTARNTFDLRVVSINGGPSTTLATVEGGADLPRFDRTGAHIYFVTLRLQKAPQKGYPARDVKRIAASGGAPSTVFTIPESLMGVQLDPIADRVIVRNGERAHVLTLAGDSVATIAWPRGFRTVGHLGFTPDGQSIVTALDATRTSIHVVPLDGGPIRALTDSSGTPWPDYWIGDHIFISGDDRGDLDALLALDGTKRTPAFDLRKANDGVPLKAFSSAVFSDGVHFLVKALNAAGDTSLFVYNSRTGEARRAAQKVTRTRAIGAFGSVDPYGGRVGSEMLYHNVRNGVVEVHLLDTAGRDRIVHSVPLPKQPELLAFAPGRSAHAYQRGDTVYVDVTIGSGKPVNVLVRPGAKVVDMVFNADGTSLYADVSTGGTGENYRARGAFFSTADARSLATPARWVESGNCWHPTWLPNGAGVVEFCQNATGTRTWVWRIPAAGPATPQIVTQRETAIFWDYALSPDGKHIAVPAVSNSGMNVWRIDLRAAAKAQRRP
jgi:hypothetical protein